MRVLMIVLCALWLVGCDTSVSGGTGDGTGGSGGACTAGDEQACSCGEAEGTRVCADTGIFGACSCDSSQADLEACIAAGGTREECASGSNNIDDGICSFDDNAIANEEGGVHGDECETDADCQYGTCLPSPLVTGGLFKICTKQCNCGVNSECSADGKVDGFESTCLRFGLSQYPDEPLTAFCQRECLTVADCKSFSELYTDCRVIVGATRVCTVTP